MTLYELREKHYFHESSIEKIDFDTDKKVIKFKISFCFWIQPWYDKSEPSNGLIQLIFEDISLFEYDADIADKIFSNSTAKFVLVNSARMGIYYFSSLRFPVSTMTAEFALNFLAKNPGYLQKSIYRALPEADKDYLRTCVHRKKVV